MRPYVILSSGVLLAHALIDGPGRGMTLIAEGDQVYAVIRVSAYAMFFFAALLSKRLSAICVGILGIGLILRGVLELKYSVLRLMFDEPAGSPYFMYLFAGLFYLGSFVIPALFAVDGYRDWTRKRKSVSS